MYKSKLTPKKPLSPTRQPATPARSATLVKTLMGDAYKAMLSLLNLAQEDGRQLTEAERESYDTFEQRLDALIAELPEAWEQLKEERKAERKGKQQPSAPAPAARLAPAAQRPQSIFSTFGPKCWEININPDIYRKK